MYSASFGHSRYRVPVFIVSLVPRLYAFDIISCVRFDLHSDVYVLRMCVCVRERGGGQSGKGSEGGREKRERKSGREREGGGKRSQNVTALSILVTVLVNRSFIDFRLATNHQNTRRRAGGRINTDAPRFQASEVVKRQILLSNSSTSSLNSSCTYSSETEVVLLMDDFCSQPGAAVIVLQGPKGDPGPRGIPGETGVPGEGVNDMNVSFADCNSR